MDKPAASQRFLKEWLLLALALLALGGALALSLHLEHRRIDADERERLGKQAEIVERNLVPQLFSANRAIESILADLPSWLRQKNGMQLADQRLRVISDTLTGVRTMLIIDAGGVVISSNRKELVGMQLAQRDYFRLARDTPQAQTLFVTPPYRTVLDSYLINLVRRIPGPDGRFAGIVVAGTDPEFFKILLDSVRATPDTLSGIFHGAGRLFLLFPERDGATGFDAASPGSFFDRHRQSGQPSSLFVGTFYATGEERMMAMRTIQPAELAMDQPLVLTVSRRLPEIFAPWEHNAWVRGALFFALLLVATAGLYRYQRRQRFFERHSAQQNRLKKVAEDALDLMAKAFTHSGEGILITDAEVNIVKVNDAFTRLTGYSTHEVAGRNPKLLSAGRTPAEVYQGMWAALSAQGIWQGELWDRRKSGETYPCWLSITALRDPAGQLTHYIGSFSDISERRKSEAKILHLAQHDALTQLPNRLTLHEELARVVHAAGQRSTKAAVMLIDLDRFKAINDTMGHHVGDQLLIEVASRLTRSVRESDIVARLGGDEFVVVLPEIDSRDDAETVAGKIIVAVSAPYLLANKTLRSSPSIGISIFPDDASDTDGLIRSADVAMYHAKDEGRCNHQFFTPQMHIAATSRLSIEADLRCAIEQQQFLLHYQPQLDLQSGRISGVEALIRWQHPSRGLVSPLEFIPIAEETGMINAIGDWVLREALRQLSEWHAEGMTEICMSVNLSASQFLDKGLPQRIDDLLREAGLAAGCLDLEVTESMAMHSPDETIAMLKIFAERGIHLSIDDFGTGYSSLAYLKLFPIDTLKIDRSFVKDIESDPNDAGICDVIVLLAHKLGLEVIAEGVETQAQLTFLTSIGCEKIQGYLLSRPQPAEVICDFIRNHRPDSHRATVEFWDSPAD